MKTIEFNCRYCEGDIVRVRVAHHGALIELEDGDTDAILNAGLTVEDARAMAYAILEATATAKPKKTKRNGGYSSLTDQAKMIFQHMKKAGSISAREAMADHGITSATLARRICDIEEAGFDVERDRRQNPITGKRYTRYILNA